MSYCDFFILATGTSRRHVSAIAENVKDDLQEALGLRPLGVEGTQRSRWVLLDYGAFVFHVFDEEARDFYDVDGLWVDAERVPLPEEPDTSVSAAAPA